MSHTEAEELLGAYALDAVPPDEVDALESHLETCPRCRDELMHHREVVGLLAYSGEDAPEGLWDRVAARMHEHPAGDATEAPPLRLLGGEGRDLGRTRPESSRYRRRWVEVLGGVAAAAVAAVGLLGAEVVHLQHQTSHLTGELQAMSGAPTMAAVEAALHTPAARRVDLRPLVGGGTSSAGQAVGLEAVILPDGQGYLFDSRLAALPAGRAYQLWGIRSDGQRISYGVFGYRVPAVFAFSAGAGLTELAVTEEVAGGVVASSNPPVVAGVID